jgi:UDPglucose--hexose-1-phosphate uridylyltransferase
MGHEVVIEHRAHDRDLADFGPAHTKLVLSVLFGRIRALESQPGVRAVLPFRNRGRRAGSSQPHPHSQLVALAHVPPRLARLSERALRVDVSALIASEASRVVATEGPWTAFCPHASERSFHVRLAGPTVRLASMDDRTLGSLAELVSRLVPVALEASGATDYNVLFNSPTLSGPSFIDVLPRTGGDAGFELESGMTVCTVDPDAAAAAMRTCANRR